MERAGLGLRCAAAVVDAGAIFLLLCLSSVLLGDGPQVIVHYDDEPAPVLGAVHPMWLTLVVLLYGLSEVVREQSLGKLVFGLRVADKRGRRTGALRRVARWAVKFLPVWLFFLFTLTGVLMLLSAARFSAIAILAGLLLALRHDGRTLHDRLSKTAVCRS